MWPTDPDDFESAHRVPDKQDGKTDEAHYFVLHSDALLSPVDASPWRPLSADEFRWLDIEIKSRHYLGRFRGQGAFAIETHLPGKPPEGFSLTPLRGLLGRIDGSLFYLAGRAKQIVEWHRDHQFCGRCGAAMVDHAQDRAKHCSGCGLISYPRLSPSIIVLVRKEDQCLLARNAQWPNGMFSTLAGFVEPGESIEQTVHREVLEEVGVRVKNLRYLGSQSWPFPNSLMLGFHADYESGEICCQEGEIAEARFFRFDQLPNVPPGTAISRWLIDAFVKERSAS